MGGGIGADVDVGGWTCFRARARHWMGKGVGCEVSMSVGGSYRLCPFLNLCLCFRRFLISVSAPPLSLQGKAPYQPVDLEDQFADELRKRGLENQ